MKEKNIIALGPKKITKKTGGLKRFLFSIESSQEHYKSVEKCSNFLDILKTLSKKNKIYYAFDERYLILAVIPYLLGNKVIFFPRGNKLMHYRDQVNHLRLKIYKILFIFLYRFCSLMVFQTKAQALEFKKKYKFKCKYKILPNNINANWISGKIERNKEKKQILKIGFCGNSSKNKGFTFLLNSLRCLLENNKIELHVAGIDKINDERKNIFLYGQVDDIRAFYEKIDLLVIPSEYDSFPNVFIECLYYEIPVLMAENDITKEILSDGGEPLLFKRDPLSLLYKIEEFSKNTHDIIIATEKMKKKYDFNWGECFCEILIQ